MMHTTKMMAIAAVAGSAMAQTATDESRAYTLEILNDSSTRSSALAQGASNGPTLFGLAQFRYDINFRDDDGAAGDTAIGFSAPRTRLGAKGNINDEISYYIQADFDSDGGSFTLLDAYGAYDMGDGMEVIWGQGKAPLTREYMTSAKYALAVDRSATDSYFNAGRVQFAGIRKTAEDWKFTALFNDGARTLNTPYTSATEADFGVIGRFEYKFAGEWDRFHDWTSWQGSEDAGVIGVAGHWQSGGETFATADMDLWQLTVDGSWESDGWNIGGAFHWRNTDMSGSDALDDFGFLLQGGVFFSEDTELFARWDMVLADDDRGASVDDFGTITVGLNHYLIPESHAAKLSFDVQYFLDEQSMSIVSPSTKVGLLSSAEDSQWNVRGQMQLVF